MENKDTLLQLLKETPDFVSGSDLADRLGVSRMSVWKYIQALRQEGYTIEAATHRGYRLSTLDDVLSVGEISSFLGELAGQFTLEVLPCCSSTNQVLKSKADEVPEWHVLLAASQSEGHGRRGRSFYSPEKTGLYLSVLLRPHLCAADAGLLTAAAAVAACRAIDGLSGKHSAIKWVNDIFLDGKKVCGILTEASLDMESGTVEQAILGVGINLTCPENGFPPELEGIAGAVFSAPVPHMRSRMAAAFLRQFFPLCAALSRGTFVREYQERSLLVGRNVYLPGPDGGVCATVVRVDGRCRLVVRYPDGRQEALSSGEVILLPKESEKDTADAGSLSVSSGFGLRLRPHHLLCIPRFTGHGYDAAFTAYLYDLAARLAAAPCTEVTLTTGCDNLCAVCPHNRHGVCASTEKTAEMDAAVLDACGLSPGAVGTWAAFLALAQDRLLSNRKWREVCRRCQWYSLCKKTNGGFS